MDGLADQAAALSLQQLDSSLPLWFKPELFLEPEFSPQTYVADLRRYVSPALPRAPPPPPPPPAAAAANRTPACAAPSHWYGRLSCNRRCRWRH